MSIKQLIIYSAFYCGILLLIANAGGVPQAVTKAPGEANHNSCATCHTPAGNFNPMITLDVLKSDSTKVTRYTPGETYIMRLTVKGSNAPKAYGFQMVSLDSLNNNDQGIWSQLGDRVRQQNLTVQGKARKYLVQSGAKTNGVFTANWKAPSTNIGKVKFYFTGLAINSNGNTSGDSNVFGQITLNPEGTSSIDQSTTFSSNVYPNPTVDILNIETSNADFIKVSALTGQQYLLPLHDKKVSLSMLPSGVYIVQPMHKDTYSGQAVKIVKL
jgi:hypothetical protein